MNKDERIQLMKIIDIKLGLILLDDQADKIAKIVNDTTYGYNLCAYGELKEVEKEIQKRADLHNKMVDAFVNEKVYVPEQLNNPSGFE